MEGEWGTLRLGDVCKKIGSGATPRGGNSVYLDCGEVALIRSQNIYNDGFHRDGLVYLTEQHAAELGNVQVEENDVLLNITGDSVARSCQVASDVLPARVNQHVAIIRPDPTVLWHRFLRYHLVSPLAQAEMLSLAGVGATRNALTKGMIESFKISAPRDVHEQRAIAHILGTLDDKIELNRRMNETLEAIARAMFKSWFVDFDPVRAKMSGESPESICQRLGLTPDILAHFPDRLVDSELGEIPERWKASSIGNHVEIFDSKRVPLSNREREIRKGIYPYYGAASLMDYIDDFLFDGIYILMGEDGSVINEDGTPVIQYVWEKFWVNNHAHVLQAKKPMSNEHLLLALKQTNIAAFVSGAVQLKLNQANLKRIPFICAPDRIIEEFAKIIAPLFAMKRAREEEIRTLTEIRDALLPKLLSGELRVPDVIEEAAA